MTLRIGLFVLVVGCGGVMDGVVDAGTVMGTDPFSASARCSSGLTRDPNESESELMMPGHACNGCHQSDNAASGGDAPIFAAAGTVFVTGHEPDNCLTPSAQGAHIVITDAAHRVFSLEVNASGNFLLEPSEFTYPYSAKVVFENRERAMGSLQMVGDCNACHTQSGSNAAPGRVVLP